MEAPISDRFATAVAHHQAGRLPEAERLYRRILADDPNNVGALNNLGLIIARDEAMVLFQRAIELAPDFADAHVNLGGAQEALGRFGEAAASYQRAIAFRDFDPVLSFRLGVMLHQQGKLDQAAACYERALVLLPGFTEARGNLELIQTIKGQVNETFTLAVIHHQAGRHAEAEALYRRILAVTPGNLSVLNNLGLIVAHDEALELFQRAAAIDPGYFDAHINLGGTLEALGRLEEAAASYQRALAVTPDSPAILSRLGTVRQQQNRPEEARAYYEQALAIAPDFTEALNNLGIVLKDLGRAGEAVACLERALVLKPDYPEAYLNLGNALRDLGRSDEAAEKYELALTLRPDDSSLLYSLGVVLQSRGKVYDAILRYERAVTVKPDFYVALNNLGLGYKEQGHLTQAIERLGQSLAIKPDYLDALLNLGNVYKDLGLFDDAVAHYDEGLRVNPDFIGALHNRLFTLTGMDSVSAETVAAEHRQAGAKLMALAPEVPAAPFANPRDPGRRLRIGYASPDFRRHSVSYFLEPLLAAHDRAGFEIFCYAEVTQPDEVTARLQLQADHWLVTAGLSDDLLAAHIRADGIDILVDLAGHTAGNRLPLFARRPAPIQATWLGYPNTTGLPVIDYRLVDAVSDPPGWGDALASETLLRLPGGFLCFAPPAQSPPPGAPPSLASGVVTFGSFNNPAKLSLPAIESWSAILKRLPDARLLLKGRQLVDPMTCELLRRRFADQGIGADRVDMLGFLYETSSHLEVYHRVDIALDPFPYNGTTTTCEALWMGVPTVALAGDRHAARVGASLLSRVGLDGLIASSRDEYVELAVGLAGDRERLTSLRAGLRPRMAASTLCDAPAFARSVETAYREIWERWLAEK